MVRIYPISDIHLEFERNPTQILLNRIPENLDVDVVVIAGDLCCLGQGLYRALKSLESREYHTIFVPGNHEAYHSSIGAVREFIDAWNRKSNTYDNVHILDNDYITLYGTLFLGGTMWFNQGPRTRGHEIRLNDYTHIHEFKDCVYAENIRFKNWISGMGARDAVVVTHHAPSKQSISSRYKNNPLNNFYYNPFGDVILNRDPPRLWIHGHTHDGCDYIHDPSGVRVVSNPVGYPFELSGSFRPDLVIEV